MRLRLSPTALDISADAAIRRLRSLRIASARSIVDQLATLGESSSMLQMYRRHFPKAYARSIANTAIPMMNDEHGYSERELEFLKLVNRKLFPINDSLIDWERVSVIPIDPQGIDWEDDPECYRPAIRAAMALASGEDEQVWEGWLPKRLRPANEPRDSKRLVRLCRRAGGLTSRFPLLLEWVTQSTGHFWLDITWQTCWEEFPWSDESIKLLTKEWKRARRFLRRVYPLLDRIDKHPRYWLPRLVRLWNRASKADEPGVAAEPESAATPHNRQR